MLMVIARALQEEAHRQVRILLGADAMKREIDGAVATRGEEPYQATFRLRCPDMYEHEYTVTITESRRPL